MHLTQAFEFFWRENPALLYGLSLLLGFFIAFQWTPLLILPCCVISIPLLIGAKHKQQMATVRLSLSLLLWISATVYGLAHYRFPDLPEDGLKGEAMIQISSIQHRNVGFGSSWIYQGTLVQFIPDNTKTIIAKNIPVSLSMKDTIERFPANQSYLVHSHLKKTDKGIYFLKIASNEQMHLINDLWNLSEWRFEKKQWLKNHIAKQFDQPLNASFLNGLATGEFDDRMLAFEFSRFGLQHLMAISGFHFALIAGALGFLLRLIPSKKWSTTLLLCSMTLYFLFLGPTSSVLRSWVMIAIALCGHLIHQKGSSLNALGVALILCLLIDPLSCLLIGFQFSFLTTGAILLFYQACDEFLSTIFIKRSLSQMIKMDMVNQHGYCVLSIFRQGIALMFSVNCVALPFTLYYFQKFPLMGFLYNLFFPFLVSLSMILLLLGLILGMVPFISSSIHKINEWYTQWILNFTIYFPKSMDVYWRAKDVPVWALIIYLSLLLVAGALWRYHCHLKQEQTKDFAFL